MQGSKFTKTQGVIGCRRIRNNNEQEEKIVSRRTVDSD